MRSSVSFWEYVCREEEEEGSSGGGDFSRQPVMQIFVCLDAMTAADTDKGRKILELFRSLDRATDDHLSIRWPHIGKEEAFAAALQRALAQKRLDIVVTPGPYIVFLEKKLDVFDPDAHKSIVMKIADASDDAIDEIRMICSEIQNAVKSGGVSLAAVQNTHRATAWSVLCDAVEFKPSVFGVAVDLKKIANAIGVRRRS